MKMSKCVRFVLLFFSFTLSLFAMEGKIRVTLKEHTEVYTSQKVTVFVEVLTDALSITDTKISFPPSDKYIVQAPSSAAYLKSEEIDNKAWQLVHYEYELYALKAGKIEIPTVSVSFSASMGYGQEKKTFSLQSERLSFDVKSPKGIQKHQFMLVTDRYQVKSTLSPTKKKLILGDAVSLTVTQQAHDVLDIVLKPIVYSSNAYLRVYPKEPKLSSGIQGEYDVSRVDAFTFVASKEGNVTLPAKALYWWDAKTEKLHKESISARAFEIIEDPQIALAAQKKVREQRWLYVAGGIVFLLLLYLLFRTKVQDYLETRARLYRESEKGKFESLLQSIERENLSEVYRCYYDWLDKIAQYKNVDAYIKNNEEIKKNFSLFEASLVSQAPFEKEAFKKSVSALRAMMLEQTQASQMMLGKALNP